MVPEREPATLRIGNWDSGWHPKMGPLFLSDDGGIRKKVVRLSSIQFGQHFKCPL